MNNAILALDQGTTSSRAILFSEKGKQLFSLQVEFPQYFPADGWVEHNPEEIWQSVLTCCIAVTQHAREKNLKIMCMGISNQRETTLVWERKTGKPIYNAIVWQDRRTFDECYALKKKISDQAIQKKTGLLLDPYFSATKIAWILHHVPLAREKAMKGELCFGTIDSYLLWQLTQGKRHATDITNASRTLLFNLKEQTWDESLLQLFDIPKNMLPEVCDNCHPFGVTDASLFGLEIPITGMAGDQQAALIGQACFSPGMMKSTYGTGCFMLLNTGDHIIQSKNRLLSTVAYRINNSITYGLEGSIFNAGTAIKWLRDSLKIIEHTHDSEKLATAVQHTHGVYFVPAFTGLGAPYWDPEARGAILGLTRESGPAHIVRAALEAVCYQTRDVMQAMIDDGASQPNSLRVDGGMASNNWLLQYLADIVDVTVERSYCIENSALGAAFLAGLGIGLFQSVEDIISIWAVESRFESHMDKSQRNERYQGWLCSVSKIYSP